MCIHTVCRCCPKRRIVGQPAPGKLEQYILLQVLVYILAATWVCTLQQNIAVVLAPDICHNHRNRWLCNKIQSSVKIFQLLG